MGLVGLASVARLPSRYPQDFIPDNIVGRGASQRDLALARRNREPEAPASVRRRYAMTGPPASERDSYVRYLFEKGRASEA